jgi:hypothetical protein
MRKSLTTLATLTLMMAMLAVHPARGRDEQAKEPEASIWMKQELVASQYILGGLTKADFGAIEKNAQSMLAVGYLEKCVRAYIPEYQKMMEDFEYANKSLTLAAREKNLDGATIAYLQLTISRVNCHKVVRGVGKYSRCVPGVGPWSFPRRPDGDDPLAHRK